MRALATILSALLVATPTVASAQLLEAAGMEANEDSFPVPTYPLYVEGVADFDSGASDVPVGCTNWPVPGTPTSCEIALPVAGAAGDTVLSVGAGPLSDCGVAVNGWAAVIQHDDGTWGVYSVTATNVPGLTITVKPPLRKAATVRTLANLYDSALGQHLTPNGYRALASHLWNYPTYKASRGNYVAQVAETTAGNAAWTLLNGISSAWVGGNIAQNYAPGLSASGTWATARNYKYIALSSNVANGGFEKTVALGGRTGYVDTYADVASDSAPLRVQIIVDGATLVDRNVYGLERVTARFTNATSSTIRFTAGAVGFEHKYKVGTTTWWVLPSVLPERIFPNRAKVVYCGDSWGVFYSGLTGTTLASYLATVGGSLTNVSVGGKTAQWARDNFATLILANHPTHAVFEFFTNDRNQSPADFTGWKANIDWLIAQSLAANIQPVIVMPIPTASFTQAQAHAQMAAMLAEGTSL